MVSRQQRAHRRGYDFENTLVNNFRDFGWNAKRLGGSSIHIPDIIATWRYNGRGLTNRDKASFDYMISLVAKGTGRDRTDVPGKEIKRCIDWFDMFPLYKEFPLRRKYVVLAYKFYNSKTGTIKGKNIRRNPREYYQLIKLTNDPNTVLERSFIPKIVSAYCNYEKGPRLVFKDNEGEQYQKVMELNKVVTTVTSFKDMIDSIIFGE